MALPTTVPPRAFLSIRWSTTLMSDAVSLRECLSLLLGSVVTSPLIVIKGFLTGCWQGLSRMVLRLSPRASSAGRWRKGHGGAVQDYGLFYWVPAVRPAEVEGPA